MIWKVNESRTTEKERIRDVYDGCLYQKHKQFLGTPGNVSFILNTDGVQIFRSSTYSIWPIWLAVNELPPNERYVQVIQLNVMKTHNHTSLICRFSKRNMILAGLWYSRDKPTMTTFLRPLIDELNCLYKDGNVTKCVLHLFK